MGLSFIISFAKFNTILSGASMRIFPFFYWLIAIYLFYSFTFGLDYSNSKSWVYLIAKVFSTLAIMVSIVEYPDFNRNKLLIIIAYIICIMTIIGHFVFNIRVYGRQGLGFVNPNSMGALSAISLGILWICAKPTKLKWIYYIACVTLFVAVMESGSRTAMLMVLLVMVFKYGINVKLIFSAIIVVASITYIFPRVGIEIIAFDRFLETVESGNASEGRENEREAALVMIKDKPWTGNGLYATVSQESLKISQFGSHNGYLDFLKMLGIPLGGLLILILLLDYLYLLAHSVKYNIPELRTVIFISTGVLLAAFNEAYLWGVNQPVTTIFFLGFGSWAYFYRVDIVNNEYCNLLK